MVRELACFHYESKSSSGRMHQNRTGLREKYTEREKVSLSLTYLGYDLGFDGLVIPRS